jgi:hypothetical protein
MVSLKIGRMTRTRTRKCLIQDWLWLRCPKADDPA